MDSMVTAAARALRAGDPLGALKRVALRDDPPALALRGIAMAQLGELDQATKLLRRAAHAFGSREPLSRARCLAAQAEVALARRDLAASGPALTAAVRAFAALGDGDNLFHAQLLQVRRLLLLGRVDAAETQLARLPVPAASALSATASLLRFEIALRHGAIAHAERSLADARQAAARAGIPALSAEVERAGQALSLPAARRCTRGHQQTLELAEVQRVLSSHDLIVDACRRVVQHTPLVVSLARRPVLFALVRVLAESWPAPAPRDRLIESAFGVTRANASHRARLRVELGRLRQQLRPVAEVKAAGEGFALAPRAHEVVVLLPPLEDPDADVLALLADGQGWSTSALALALGRSQRTVQRSLAALANADQVRAVGEGRARRWLSAPVSGFTTTLLLPPPAAAG